MTKTRFTINLWLVGWFSFWLVCFSNCLRFCHALVAHFEIFIMTIFGCFRRFVFCLCFRVCFCLLLVVVVLEEGGIVFLRKVFIA